MRISLGGVGVWDGFIGVNFQCRPENFCSRKRDSPPTIPVMFGKPHEDQPAPVTPTLKKSESFSPSSDRPLFLVTNRSHQVLSRDDLTAFNQHLSSVIPLLLSLAEAPNSRTGGSPTGGPVNRSDGQGPGVDGGLRRGNGPMERFRAVRCLTALTALPYSRLHPFKTQVMVLTHRDFHCARELHVALLRAHAAPSVTCV